MDIVTLSERGQLVIPHQIRRKLDLAKGRRLYVEFSEKDRTIILRPVDTFRTLRGFLKGTPPANQMLKTVRMEERKQDEARRRR